MPTITDADKVLRDDTGIAIANKLEEINNVLQDISLGDQGKLDGLIDGSITSVKSDVESIAAFRFYNMTSLISASFPNVTTIGDSIFKGCTSLTNVYMPSLTGGTGISHFSECTSLTSISLPELVTAPTLFLKNSGITSISSTDFPKLTTIGDNFCKDCQSLTSVSFPLVTTIEKGAFNNCTNLTSVDFPEVTTMTQTYSGGIHGQFGACINLTTINFPKLLTIDRFVFNACRSLESANFPEVTEVKSNAFDGCTKLKSLDFTKLSTIQINAFYGDTLLNTLIIRSPSVCTLESIQALHNTPFASNGAGGTLYVPQALISSYQSASQWSTLLGYPNNQILPIEGSPYEITD